MVDGDCRGQSVNIVNIGLIHLSEEHAGVGAEALHIAALTLSVNCIEGKAGFAAARKPGHDHELVSRYFNINVFKVVFSCAFYEYAVVHSLLLGYDICCFAAC